MIKCYIWNKDEKSDYQSDIQLNLMLACNRICCRFKVRQLNDIAHRNLDYRFSIFMADQRAFRWGMPVSWSKARRYDARVLIAPARISRSLLLKQLPKFNCTFQIMASSFVLYTFAFLQNNLALSFNVSSSWMVAGKDAGKRSEALEERRRTRGITHSVILLLECLLFDYE